MKKLATEIYLWCKENNLWGDNIIYFNGKAWSSYDAWHDEEGKLIAPRLYEYSPKDPKDYIEYANEDTITMSFEGPLYSVLNYGWEWSHYEKLEREFSELLEKYGYYYEMGYAWSLALYEL